MSIITTELITRLEEYNPHYAKVIKKMMELHLNKGHDYATFDAFGNFKFAAQFTKTETTNVMRTLIGIKMARLINLISTGDEANFESLNDTLFDLANYILIYFAYQETAEYKSGHIPDPFAIPDTQPDVFKLPKDFHKTIKAG